MQLAQWCAQVLAIDPGAMAKPMPPNVVHIPLTVEAAVVAAAEGASSPLVAAMEGNEGNTVQAHICVCDINAAPSKTLQVRNRPDVVVSASLLCIGQLSEAAALDLFS